MVYETETATRNSIYAAFIQFRSGDLEHPDVQKYERLTMSFPAPYPPCVTPASEMEKIFAMQLAGDSSMSTEGKYLLVRIVGVKQLSQATVCLCEDEKKGMIVVALVFQDVGEVAVGDIFIFKQPKLKDALRRVDHATDVIRVPLGSPQIPPGLRKAPPSIERLLEEGMNDLVEQKAPEAYRKFCAILTMSPSSEVMHAACKILTVTCYHLGRYEESVAFGRSGGLGKSNFKWVFSSLKELHLFKQAGRLAVEYTRGAPNDEEAAVELNKMVGFLNEQDRTAFGGPFIASNAAKTGLYATTTIPEGSVLLVEPALVYVTASTIPWLPTIATFASTSGEPATPMGTVELALLAHTVNYLAANPCKIPAVLALPSGDFVPAATDAKTVDIFHIRAILLQHAIPNGSDRGLWVQAARFAVGRKWNADVRIRDKMLFVVAQREILAGEEVVVR